MLLFYVIDIIFVKRNFAVYNNFSLAFFLYFCLPFSSREFGLHFIRQIFDHVGVWLLPDFEEFGIFVDDVHEDAVDVAAELGVDVLLFLQSCAELNKENKKQI